MPIGDAGSVATMRSKFAPPFTPKLLFSTICAAALVVFSAVQALRK